VGCTSLASEFPNDNAEISSGAVWICQNLTGPATLQAPPFQPVAAVPFVFWFDDDEASCEGPVDIQISDGGPSVTVHAIATESFEAGPTVAEAGPTVAEAGPAVVEVAPIVAQPEPSSTEDEAPILADTDAPVMLEPAPENPATPAFAHFEQALSAILMAQSASRAAALLPKFLRLEALPGDALTKDVQLTLQSRGYLDGSGRYSPKFRDLCGAWIAVLQGSSQDFAACGTTTLDRFGADLLAALLAVPATRSDELRRELRKAGIAAFGILEATAA
jgi:hypothetical protein